MVVYRSVVCTVKAAVRDDVNRVWEAMDRGPNTFSVPLSPTGSEPATYYYMHDGSATADDAAIFQALTDGTLPTVGYWGNPITWGQNGLISEADAIAACGSGNLGVSSWAGGLDPTEHTAAVRAGLGVQIVVPDDPTP